ncbi:MAG TPA: DUF3501 family protein [Anaeromyxobacteraceae bacterium]|nr:DUF3501 family protein [Anaeromyxobacteraceae bacterium]
MRKVAREEILDLKSYDEQRAALRPAVLEAKRVRRVHLGEALTFLFENAETVRYQILEMVRVERLYREEEIRHELDTYNELLGKPGELGCALLIEIEDVEERDRKLRAWLGLPDHLFLKLPDGRRVRPVYDRRQVGDERLSSVQYLKFDVGGVVPVAVGCDLPALALEADLTAEQRAALAADLASDLS